MTRSRFPKRIIQAIIAKDLKDALRDGRIMLGLAMIVGVAMMMGLTSPEDTRTKATLTYWSEGETALPKAIKTVGSDVIDLRITRSDDAIALRDAVRDKEADIALLVPNGFDAAVAQGARPEVTVVVADPPSGPGAAVMATVEPALRVLGGQGVPADVEMEPVRAEFRRGEAAVDQIGLRRFAGLVGILGIMAMVGLFMVPMILAEETEKKTIEALAMATSYRVIVAAKAMVGLVVSVGLAVATVVITDLAPADLPTFTLAFVLTALLFVGTGLLLGGLFSATTVNTWSGLLIVVLLAPAFMMSNPPPWPAIDSVFTVLPSSQALRLGLNGVSGTDLFPDVWLSYVVLAVWMVAIYALLIRRLSTREL
jgi:hypothetical protein